MPGFHGIRMQQIGLYASGRDCWNRTHSNFSAWPANVPYVDKRQNVYHKPNALRLEVFIKFVLINRDETS